MPDSCAPPHVGGKIRQDGVSRSLRHFAGSEAFPGGRLHGAPALPGKTGAPFHGKAFRAESFPPFRIAGDPIDHYAAGETAGIGGK